MQRSIVLASTSPYRQQLLQRLGLPFRTAAPGVDETPRTGEMPMALVRRLAEAKARAVASRFPHTLVIGCDQAAVLDGAVLGKPRTRDRATAQLTRASGRTVRFLSGLCVLDTSSAQLEVDVVAYDVVFRHLTSDQIERYVEIESPLDCAGSIRSEGLGIVLFERMEGPDPSALVGLPLIRLVTMLQRFGIELL